MKPMGCCRAVAVAVVLAGGVFATATPAGASWANPGGQTTLDAMAAERPSLGREGGFAEERGAVLSVNIAIMALGSLWLALMARRIQLRGGGGMLSSAAPRHVAGGR